MMTQTPNFSLLFSLRNAGNLRTNESFHSRNAVITLHRASESAFGPQDMRSEAPAFRRVLTGWILITLPHLFTNKTVINSEEELGKRLRRRGRSAVKSPQKVSHDRKSLAIKKSCDNFKKLCIKRRTNSPSKKKSTE